MERAEYWILDCALETSTPLCGLVSEQIEELFNRGSHGLSRPELIDLLGRMFGGGDLVVRELSRRELEKVGELFVPDIRQIEAGLRGERNLYYSITEQGGAKWEEVSKPEWSRYVSGWKYEDPKEFREGEAASMDRELVEEQLSMWSGLGVEIQFFSQKWDRPAPWQATYWKSLPEGHRVTFLCRERFRNDFFSRTKVYQRWLEKVESWYTNPFEERRW